MVFPNLTNESLLSVGQLCDNVSSVCFDKNHTTINKTDNQIRQGIRNKNDGLWDIKLSPNNINGTE